MPFRILVRRREKLEMIPFRCFLTTLRLRTERMIDRPNALSAMKQTLFRRYQETWLINRDEGEEVPAE